MGHIEPGIGVEQQQEEEQWASRGGQLDPVDNTAQTGV